MPSQWIDQLGPDELEQLRRGSARHEFKRGETVFRPNSEPRGVFFLTRGLVRIYRLSASGREATLGYIRSGEVFGELSLFSGGARQSFGQALLSSSVLEIERAAFDGLLRSHPTILAEVSRQLARRLRRLESRCEDLMLRDVCGRLGHHLLEIADDFGRPGRNGLTIVLPISQQNLATSIGTSRQSVNICLREMRAEGLITYARGRVTILRPKALRLAVERRSGET